MTQWGSRKLIVKEHNGSAATAQTVWSVAATSAIALVHLQVTCELAGQLRVYFGTNTAGNRLVNIHAGDNGGIVREFEPRSGRVAAPGTPLKVLHDGGGLVTVIAEGFSRQ